MTGLLRSASEEIAVLAKKKLHRWSNWCERTGAKEEVLLLLSVAHYAYGRKGCTWRRRNRRRKTAGRRWGRHADVVPPTPLPTFKEQMELWSFPPPINSALCECLTGNFTHLSIEMLEALSFGVLLLELLTGRKPVDHTMPRGQQGLVTWVTPRLSEDKVKRCVDPKLKGEYPPKGVAYLAAVAA
ncbi:hypothetical protein H0E87_000217 [Populus deltoides]|uniref:Serine-threonine/tyrosine-protein kinase catalytic domain-containing protein n=1 Tax=Populus deltoides TaxID=3696 RepID=A0A8T2ZNB6_POPDE|nr:hypothetical protein H0E87_000217 [Populus deltoides]